ncbi:hypothetical protein M011DRAFT_331718 [Sporormia fimetaria CBS 119925]|uniref:NmrA-like domain-containing protein n=1 Tax=Sporormia fimetaria CBS 119925 TaxID=1340428 RepID=A0A6A6VDA7_9PLEO|nr:hypothetical protein M011DRAFT_331718 [Sporormia fimetaria CBS 119925]
MPFTMQTTQQVICTLLIRDPTWTSTHLRLLTASLRANVQRFAPAEWGPGPLAAHNIPMFHPQLAVRDACRLARAQNAGFEFTCFHPGLFMNYLGYGSPNAQEALAGFDDNWQDIWWRVDEMRATIPLTREGKEPRCTMTEIRDVGRFVAEACLLAEGKWREDFSMVGETLGMDEVVRVVERVRGREMEVVYRGFDEVVEKKERELDAYRRFWWELEEMMARERVGEGVVEPVLNALCPDVRPMGVRKYVEKYWGQDV